MNKRSVGSEKEELAAKFLANKGYLVVKNFISLQRNSMCLTFHI